MNKKAAFIRYITMGSGNSTPEEKFTGTILTYNGYVPYSNNGTMPQYDLDLRSISMPEKVLNWEIEVPTGMHKVRFDYSSGVHTVDLYLGDDWTYFDNWKEEVRETTVSGQVTVTLITDVYVSNKGIKFSGAYAYTSGQILDDKAEFVSARYNHYANKYLKTIEII